MYKNRLITCIVILSLLYTNCVFALNKTSEFTNPRFSGSIKPLALVSNLFKKKASDIEDLLLIKSSLIEYLGLEQVSDVALVYNKKTKELFVYDKTHIFRISGSLDITRYEYTKDNEREIKNKESVIILPREAIGDTLPPPPARLQKQTYLRVRFWVGFGFLCITTPIGLIIYGCYSILESLTDIIQKWRLTEEKYQEWIEYRRDWLLNTFAIRMLKILPRLRVELRDVIRKMPPDIWLKSDTYSAKKILPEKVFSTIRHRSYTDKRLEGIKTDLRGIIEGLGETNLLEVLDKTPIYLVYPEVDVNCPFIYYDKNSNSYLFTLAAGEPPGGLSTTLRLKRFIIGGKAQYLRADTPTGRGNSNIYIGQFFYEQLSGQKPLVMMLLLESLLQLTTIPQETLDKIKGEIGTTGTTLGNAKTMIKNAYFAREREPDPAEWSKGLIRSWLRNRILQVITWSNKFYNWAHFMQSFVSEFFFITRNWIRTPFVYPLRSNLHCGIPTPDKPLPEYGTYLWAIQEGFSDEAARIMGEADICTDKLTSGYIPRLGIQSRHYNMYQHNSRWQDLRGLVKEDLSQIDRISFEIEYYNPGPQLQAKTDIRLSDDEKWSEANYPDTRLDWAQYELERAGYYYRIGEKILALESIGRGLHSLQDLVAHRDFDVGPYGTRIHPPELDDIDYDFDPSGRLVQSSERRRLKETERLTKLYLNRAKERFKKIEEELSQRYYPRLGYFEIGNKRYYIDESKKGIVETLAKNDWIRENISFTYAKIKFKDGIHERPAASIVYVSRILSALTGINTTISKIEKFPFPGNPANASKTMELLELISPCGTEIMVTVEGGVQKEFLDRALAIIVNEVFGDEIFNDIGLNPSAKEEEEHPDLFYKVLHKKERILYLINTLALDIKNAQEDRRPFAEEAEAQKTLKDTYLNINLAIVHGIADEAQRDRIAPYVYFLLRRLDEIKGEVSTRPIRPLSPDVPREPDRILSLYTKELLEYAILSGLIANPLEWYERLSRLKDDFILSPLRLQSFKNWLEIAEYVKNENPGLSITELKEKITDCYYETYGDIAARKLGSVELSLDIIANGINTFSSLKEELSSLLPKANLDDLHNYLINIHRKHLLATRVVGYGLLTQGGVTPELRTLLLGEPPEDLIARLGVGESVESLSEAYPDRFRTANSWQRIYEYVQALTEIGKKPKRILVDLDMTVFTPNGYLGSYPWFDQRIRETDRHRTFWEWGDHERRMEKHRFFRLVDPEIPGIIEKLKAQGIEVVGFTARMWKKDSRRTKSILSRLGIRFSQIAFVPGIYQYGGVVYTFGQGVHKSKAFEKLTRGRNSEVTVIIDDALTNITNILKNTASTQTYGVLYRTRAVEPLLTLKAHDYLKLGDTALIQGQFDFAEEYYMNAVEQARYLNPLQKPGMFREIWKRVVKLNLLEKDTEGLVRFLTHYDDSKEDLWIMDRRLKDPYLNLLTLVRTQPITDRERPRVLVYEITEFTDLIGLKALLRTVRSIHRQDGSPKFRTVLTSQTPAIKIRQKIKKQDLEEGIDYDYWQIPTSLIDADIITISSDTPQATYEAIADAEGYTEGIPVFPAPDNRLIDLREDAKRKIESLRGIERAITISFYPDTDGIAYAVAETIFLRKYLGNDIEIIYAQTTEKTTYIHIAALNGEVLRQTKGLVTAALYLEETQWPGDETRQIQAQLTALPPARPSDDPEGALDLARSL